MNLFKSIFEWFKDMNKAVDTLMNEPKEYEYKKEE